MVSHCFVATGWFAELGNSLNAIEIQLVPSTSILKVSDEERRHVVACGLRIFENEARVRLYKYLSTSTLNVISFEKMVHKSQVEL